MPSPSWPPRWLPSPSPRRVDPVTARLPGSPEPGPDEPPIPDEERESAWGLLRRAEALLLRRHDAQAVILLERADRLAPGQASIVEALARAAYNGGRLERAEAAFDELVRIDPASAYGRYGLAQVYRRSGRAAEARTQLRLACALAPDSALYREALLRLG